MGFSLFARRYSGYHESRVLFARTYARTERNSHCSLFLRVLRCFTSPGSLRAGVTPRISAQRGKISPFGYLRIKGYKPPPRSFSQVSRVLLRHPRPRHPPRTLNYLSCGTLYTTIIIVDPVIHSHEFYGGTLPSTNLKNWCWFNYLFIRMSKNPRIS